MEHRNLRNGMEGWRKGKTTAGARESSWWKLVLDLRFGNGIGNAREGKGRKGKKGEEN